MSGSRAASRHQWVDTLEGGEGWDEMGMREEEGRGNNIMMMKLQEYLTYM